MHSNPGIEFYERRPSLPTSLIHCTLPLSPLLRTKDWLASPPSLLLFKTFRQNKSYKEIFPIITFRSYLDHLLQVSRFPSACVICQLAEIQQLHIQVTSWHHSASSWVRWSLPAYFSAENILCDISNGGNFSGWRLMSNFVLQLTKLISAELFWHKFIKFYCLLSFGGKCLGWASYPNVSWKWGPLGFGRSLEFVVYKRMLDRDEMSESSSPEPTEIKLEPDHGNQPIYIIQVRHHNI